LAKIVELYKSIGFAVNVSKIESYIFNRPAKYNFSVSLDIDGSVINKSVSLRYLGIMVQR
jgi:hypothetical protein